MSFWQRLSNYGVDDDSEISLRKRIILSNQLSIVLSVVFLCIALLLTFKMQLFGNALIIGILVLIIIGIPFLNKAGFKNLSRLALSSFIPLFIVFASIYGKVKYEDGRDIIFYVSPRIIMIASVVVPLVLFDVRDKFYFYISLIFNLLCVGLYAKIHILLGVGIENASLHSDNHFVITIISIFSVFILALSYIFMQRLNIKYENKLRDKNKALIEKEYVLQETNNELLASEEEIRQSAEELQTLNDNLQEVNSLVTEKNTKLEHQNTKISIQNTQIENSIRYAKTIQNSILPTAENMERCFNYFLIYRPKDIVSGDFYWMYKCEKFTFIAVVDCTGHGVPGAFMSLISSRLLNKIVKNEGIYEPKAILKRLNLEIEIALQQKVTENDDGMDIILCRFDRKEEEKRHVVFSAAKSTLILLDSENKKIRTFRGGSYSVGGYSKYDITPIYEQGEFDLNKDDTLYLCSDGYTDQNNEKRQNIKLKNLIHILADINKKPLAEQKSALEEYLTTWQKNEIQRDDITVLGLKLKD